MAGSRVGLARGTRTAPAATQRGCAALDRSPSALRQVAWRDCALWIALLLALSPSLLDLAAHWVAEPWARPSAIFAPLWLVSALRDRSLRRPHVDGYLLMALGLAIALASVGGGMTRLGRPGIPLAMVGLARALGRPALPRALVAAWMIPLPNFITHALSPGLEALVGKGAAVLAHALGLHVSFADGQLSGPAGALALEPADGGLPLAAMLAGLAWYRAASSDAPLRAAARAALRAAPWGLAAQTVGLCIACALAIAGAPGTAADILHNGVWLAAAAVFLLRARSRPESPGRMRLNPGALARRAQ